MDINAAIEHMRSRNEPMYGAWEVCKAAGIDPKRQARLFANPAIMSFMAERGLLYTKQRTGSGRMLAVVAAPEILRKPERAQAIREEHLEAVRRSTEKARESRRHYKRRGKEDNANSPPLHPFTLEEARLVIAAMDRTTKRRKEHNAAIGKMSYDEWVALPDVAPEDEAIMRRVLHPETGYPYDPDLLPPDEKTERMKDGVYDENGKHIDYDADTIAHVAKARGRTIEEMTPPPLSDILTAPTIRRMRLLVQQEDNKALDQKRELERPQREAKAAEDRKDAVWHKRKSDNIRARVRQDKVAAEAAYSVGLVARVDLPDPNQLDLWGAAPGFAA